jgi:dTDP-4-amino-4,6-dideoxygalactose transaminase
VANWHRIRALLAELDDDALQSVVPRAEDALRKVLGVPHFALAASGLSAMQAALFAAGIRPGDEVVCDALVPYGVMAVLNSGAVPVLADIDEATLTLSPRSVGRVLSVRTRAVLATAIFGVPPDVASIRSVISGASSISLITDSCQAFGASISGAELGPSVDAACFSFQMGKPLSCGYGGGVATSSEQHDARVRRYLNLGWYPRESASGTWAWDRAWRVRTRGASARIAPVAACLLLARLPSFRAAVAERLAAIRQVESAIAGIPGLQLQQATPGFNGQRWKIAAMARDEQHSSRLAQSLRARGSRVYRFDHPPVSEWPAFNLVERLPLPVTRLTLPKLLLFPVATRADAERESAAVHDIL